MTTRGYRILGQLRRYLIMTLGCLISCSAINLFLVPNHLLSGGASGVAMISYYLFGLPIGLQVFLINIPLLMASYKWMGRAYTMNVLFCAAIFSTFVDMLRFLGQYNAVTDPLIAAIYGGIFTGIGYGLMFKVDGSSAGLDIVAAIVKKYYSFDMGSVIFAVNCVIMSVAAILFGPQIAMLTLISMFIGANITDKVVAGFNNKKSVIIVSMHGELIAEAILSEIGRGVTFLKGEGAFTHQDKNVIFVVANLTQLAKIKAITSAVDSAAFMIVQDAREVMGRGFSLPGAERYKKMEMKHKFELRRGVIVK
ncbi:MAG: YitT family protein [Selenomonadaceae bacterium]